MSSILVGQRVLFNVLREVSPKHLRGVIKYFCNFSLFRLDKLLLLFQKILETGESNE